MLTLLIKSRDPEISTDSFEAIGRILKTECGFSLDGYKDRCVKRRIGIRLRATSRTPEDYRELLARDAGERQHLLRALTIHVSQFFRNPSSFEKLSNEIIPQLIRERGASRALRLLSVGCAGGEEPYSLALIIRERFADALAQGEILIRGTDVDASTLEAAREALYGPERLSEVPGELLERWFSPEGGRYRLSPEIRSLVSFERVDLNDPPHRAEPCDLIMCRNVLIYFERDRQEAILNRFADLLTEGGFLVLGKSETLFGSARRRFRTVCPVERIYRAV